ncbi:MAG TPA: aldo/keto reductase [Solirubrobacterales bacterium]|nr:aldo/keto reductase [Solirubrobacterales bacterium]
MAAEAISDDSVGTLALGDPSVRRLGFGAMRITGEGVWGPPADHDAAIAVLRRAVELGVNLIDTANSYGPDVSEELIAEALHPYPEDLVIATKGGFTRPGPGKWVPNGRPEYLREACEGSLRRLRTERIDLYQMHVPDRDVPYEESIGALKELQDEGKVNQIGVSNVSARQLATARGIVDVVSVQNRFNLGDRSAADVLAICQEEGLGFIPWFPLDAGSLVQSGGAAAEIAGRHGATPAQIALAWLLRTPATLPIPGTGSVAHLEENLAAASIQLSDDEVEELTTAV